MFLELLLMQKEPVETERHYAMVHVERIVKFEPAKNHCRIRMSDGSIVETELSYENVKAAIGQSGIPLLLNQGNQNNEPFFKEREIKTPGKIINPTTASEEVTVAPGSISRFLRGRR